VEVLEVLHTHRAELSQLNEVVRHRIISELISNNDSQKLEQKLQELLTFNKGLQPLITPNAGAVTVNRETAVYPKETR
jgi:hypothetical protein